MNAARITDIRKRDNSIVPFDPGKIEVAIYKAMVAEKVDDRQLAARLARQVVELLEGRFGGKTPGVENVQDIVEEVLMSRGYPNVARAYILYRQQRADVRHLKKAIGVRDDLKLTVNAIRVLERRYLLRDEEGRIVETPGELFRRVARAVAGVETRFDPAADVRRLEDTFYGMMSRLEFMPNTPTLMNAGAPLGQLSACFVLPVEDSIVDIFDTLKNMALIHQSGGGTGFTFSHLRPKGDLVRSTKGVASGPVSFMKIFDVATGVMKQGGKRRGANMGILNDDHPDIVEFVVAKSNEAVLTNFNISVGTSDEFMAAVERGEDRPLINPRTKKEVRSVNARDLFEMMQIARTGTLRGVEGVPDDIRRVFVTDWDITPEWHVRMQSVFQKYTDNSVSKTINLPAEASPDDVRRVYRLAHQLKCKGITIYRYGSKKQQVLTLAGRIPAEEEEAPPYVTVESEYAGGCPTGTCPF